MRPSDQNQHASTRPNLLSGARRHVGGDDNILERLERDCARHASGNRSRAVWYAAAAGLVLLLMVALAWTAYDNVSAVRVVPMTRVPAERGTLVPADTKPDALVLPRPAHIAPQDGTADALPPLVLLPSHEVAASKTSVPTRATEQAATAVASIAVPAPVRSAVRPSPVVAPAATAARPAARPVVAMRQHKPGAGPMQADTGTDTDVALLSAIIIHDSAHAEEKAQLEAAAACMRAGAKKCPGRASNGAAMAN